MSACQWKRQVVAALAALSLVGTASAEVSLPADYVQLEWIGTETGAEYVNTHYLLQTGDAIETTVELDTAKQPTTWTALFGCAIRNSDDSITYHTFQPNSGNAETTKARYTSGGTMSTAADNLFPKGVNVTLRCQNETASWTSEKGGASLTLQGAKTMSGISPLFILSQNAAKTPSGEEPDGTQTKAKLYAFTIFAADGVTVRRNYVPCRRKTDGAAGLYETVEGGFFPNAAAKGRFYGSDETDLRYSYVQFSASQRSDTGYIHTPNTTVEMVFFAPMPASFPENNCQALFGSHNGDDSGNSMGFFPWHTYNGKSWEYVVYDRDSVTTGTGFIYDAWVKMVCDAEGARWANLDGSGTPQQVTSPTGTRTDGVYSLIINGLRAGSNYYGSGLEGIKFRSFTISEPTDGIVRNFVPMRRVNGSIGLYDTVEGGCISTVGVYGGVLHTVSDDDDTISVYEGTLAPDDLFGRSTVEKKGWRSVDASNVTTYPSLALCEGTLSFQNGVVTAHTVTGTLKFAGGARWAVDWVGTACDSFSAESVDLTEASAANPVKVVVNVTDATLDPNCPVELLSSGVTAEDAEKFVAVGVSAQFEVQDGKLCMKFADTTLPMRAEWTGDGERGKLSDVRNWNCYNCFDEPLTDALPTNVTVVTIPTGHAGSFEWPESETLAYKQFVFPASVTLTQNCDWRGMTMPLNGTITLNGKKLYLKSLEGTGTFTDSSNPGGELVVDVSQGQTLTYTGGMKLGGTLKLVKIGTGVLQGAVDAAAKNQTFTGGTEIHGGTVNASGWGTDWRWGAQGGTITVCTNSVFEFQGNPYFNGYTFVLNGGTLRNTTDVTKGKAWQMCGIKNVRLAADSTIDFPNSYSLMDGESKYNPTTLDLGGHTLTVNYTTANGKHCYFSCTTATRGTMVLNGQIQFVGGDFVGPQTTFDLYGYLFPEKDVHVGTYICRTTSGSSDVDVDVYVYERFKPITDKFWGCILKNGATLDLSARTEPWDVKGKFHTKGKTTVQFEDNATIYVDLGSRKLKSGDQVVVWDDGSRPANLATLRFKPASGQGGAIVKASNGLRFVRGLVILVR